MRINIRQLIKSKVFRNIAIVASGTAASQVLAIVFSPVITRLYGPESYGLLGTFMAIAAMLTPILALSYPFAIILPRAESEAREIARLSFYIALCITIFIALILLVAGRWVMDVLNIQSISSFIFLVPLVIFFSALLQIAQQWLIRKKQFAIKAKVSVAQALILYSAKVGIGLFYPVAAVLIFANVIGRALHAAMLARGIVSSNKMKMDTKTLVNPKTSLLGIAKKYSDFPLFRTPQLFLNAISQSLPVLMLASFFGPAQAGFYALGKRLLEMPTQLISRSVGDVFYTRIAEASRNNENLSFLIIKATLPLCAIGFLPFAFVVVFGPKMFGFIFGAEWVVAGEYARWLALWQYTVFMNPPSVKAFIVLKIQHLGLIINAVSIIFRIGAILLGALWFKSALSAVAGYALVGISHNIITILIAFIKSKQSPSKEALL